MATIKPFAGIRPCREKAARIAALPYDVYNRQEAKAEVLREPESFLKIDRAETQFDDSVDTYAPQVYERAHDTLWSMVENGDFIRDDKRCYYIYELTMDARTQTGVVAVASIDDYQNGIIKKHENTREEKEQDRIRHVDICDAQTGPIFLAYRANDVIREVVSHTKQEEPEYDFTSPDGISHRVWVIREDADLHSIETAFAGIGQIYIADGHHRAASAVKVGLKRRAEHPDYDGTEEFNYFLSVLFPDEELYIMDYNRVVKDLNGMSADEFLGKMQEIFEVAPLDEMPGDGTDREQCLTAWRAGKKGSEPCDGSLQGESKEKTEECAASARIGKEWRCPQEKGSFTMYLNDMWYLCKVRKEDRSDDPVKGLDVSLLQDLMLQPVLGIDDPKTNPRIDFVGGIRGMDELERRCHEDAVVAFAMYPTSIGELFAVADAGLLMPPKSTWFEPKLRSGLFLHALS